MTAEQLEQRLSSLERAVSELLAKVGTLPKAPLKPWERPAEPMMEDEARAFEEVLEYGRYFRRTGREAPPEWNPGDPIPEPDWWN